MKFSIKFLLAVTVLAGLSANLLLIGRESRRIEERLTETTSKLVSAQISNSSLGAAYDDLLFRAASSEVQLATRFSASASRSEHLGAKYSQLSIVDKNLLSVRVIPNQGNRPGSFHAFRIYVPATRNIALRIEPVDFQTLARPDEPTLIRLGPGEHEITCSYNEAENEVETDNNKSLEKHFVVELDGTNVVKVVTKLPSSGSSSSALYAPEQNDYPVGKKLPQLLRLIPQVNSARQATGDRTPNIIVTLVDTSNLEPSAKSTKGGGH